MRQVEDRVCRFCLSIISDESLEEIRENIKQIVELFHLKFNFHVNAEPVVCSSCKRSVQECVDFQSTYLEAENFIVPLYNTESKAKLDLREVYMQKNKNMATADIARNQQICRFCIKLINKFSYKLLIEIEEDMIQKYIPELNFSLTEEPVICDSCRNSLKFYFQFLQICADTEEKIIKYCKFEAIGYEGPINLNQVVQFSKNIIEHERNVTDGNVIYLDDLCCENNENKLIKSEVMVKDENTEFYPENCENGIKIDVEENNMKEEINRESLEAQNVELKITYEQNELQTSTPEKGKVTNGCCNLEETDSNIQINLNEVVQSTEDMVKNGRNMTKADVDLDGFRLVEKQSVQFGTINIENVIKTCYVDKSLMMEIRDKSLELQNETLEIINDQNDLETEQSNFESFGNALTSSQMIMKNINTRVYKCESCSYTSKEKGNLNRHMLSHQKLSEVTVYRCDSCSFVTKYKCGLRSHNMSVHPPSKTTVYNCLHCLFKTIYKGDLKQHMLIHREFSEITLYNCNQCSFKTKHQKYLKSHVLIHQELSSTVYKCDSCSYVAKRRDYLKRHVLTHRKLSKVTVYGCDSCPYVAKRKGNLKTHKLTHQELSEVTVYRCDSCSYVAKHKGNLKTHMLTHREPSEITVYRCTRCSYVAKRKSNLIKHMSTHRELSEVTVHKCGSCSYVARQKSNLKMHMLTHKELSEITVYRCDSCSYIAKHKGNLKRHMLTHRELSEITVYSCARCSYRTRQKSSLKRHMLTHREKIQK